MIARLRRGDLEALGELYRELGNRAFAARTLGYLGFAALLRGDPAEAEAYFRQSLRDFSDLHESMGIAEDLEGLASVFAVTSRPQGAARLAAAAGAIREAIAAQPLPLDRDTFQAYMERARAGLTVDAWSAAWQEGCNMTADQAVALALE